MPTVRACNHGCRSNSFRTHQLRVKFDIPVIAEPLGEAGNRGARSRNAFICMYIYIYILYICPSQTIIASIDCAIGKMVRPIRQSFLAQQKTSADRRFRHVNYVVRTLLHSQRFFSVRCPQTWQFISILCTISTTTPCQRGSLHFNVCSSISLKIPVKP